MNGTESRGSPELHGQQDVLEHVRQTADGIHDPCGMAMGVRIGLNEMGLLRQVAADPDGDGWSVYVQLRLTSPGCQYFFAFKDNLEEQLSAHPQISGVTVEWDPTIDWTPEDLARSARIKLEERRRELGRVPQGIGASAAVPDRGDAT